MTAPPIVILSERSESKDLRIRRLLSIRLVQRSFDSGLRPPLRMTNRRVRSTSPPGALKPP